MIAREQLNDYFENGYAYDVRIRFGNGNEYVARFPDYTPEYEGISKAFMASHADITGAVKVFVDRMPKTKDYHPLVFRNFLAVKVDGKRTGETFRYRDKEAKIAYLKKYLGHKVELVMDRRLVRSDEVW